MEVKKSRGQKYDPNLYSGVQGLRSYSHDKVSSRDVWRHIKLQYRCNLRE